LTDHQDNKRNQILIQRKNVQETTAKRSNFSISTFFSYSSVLFSTIQTYLERRSSEEASGEAPRHERCTNFFTEGVCDTT
jgi:hypothetical protein